MKDRELKITGEYAASLSIIEIGLGSVLHATSIPLSGQILSVNQIAILSRASFREESKNIALKISLISSILKSLSPAGKKLTPMVAILAQGILFSLGLTIFGVNYLGLFFSVLLSSAWSFIQPLLILYFLFGKNILDVLNYFKKDFIFLSAIDSHAIITLLIGTYLLKVFIVFLLSFKMLKMSELNFKKLQTKLNIRPKANKRIYRNQFFNAFFDLMQPLFVISFILTAFFIFLSNESFVSMIWILLRPLSLGLIIFYIFRIYPIEKVIIFLEKRGMIYISQSLKIATESMKKNREL